MSNSVSEILICDWNLKSHFVCLLRENSSVDFQKDPDSFICFPTKDIQKISGDSGDVIVKKMHENIVYRIKKCNTNCFQEAVKKGNRAGWE